MGIVHRLATRDVPAVRTAAARVGLRAKPGAGALVFEIAEDDPRWPDADAFLSLYAVTRFVRTDFAPSELDGSRWLSRE